MLSLMKLCVCTTINCGPNVKSFWVLVTFPRFGSTKYCWESSCSINLCSWSRMIVIWKSCFPTIRWLKITSYWLILLFFVVLTSAQVYYSHQTYRSKLVVFHHFENSTSSFFSPFLQIQPMSLQWQGILKLSAVIPTITNWI